MSRQQHHLTPVLVFVRMQNTFQRKIEKRFLIRHRVSQCQPKLERLLLPITIEASCKIGVRVPLKARKWLRVTTALHIAYQTITGPIESQSKYDSQVGLR